MHRYKFLFLVLRILRSILLATFKDILGSINCSHHAEGYILWTYLSYNWKSKAFGYLHP